MFILDTDHISLFQRNHPHVSAHILATPPLELATTVVTVEEQLRAARDEHQALLRRIAELEMQLAASRSKAESQER